MIWTLISQILGYAAGTLFSDYEILVHMAVSGLISISLKLPKSWVILNFFLPLLLLLPDINPLIPFIGLALLLLIFAPILATKAPLFLSNNIIVESIADELPKCRFTFIDLGCGTGGVLRILSKKFPEGTFYGYELGVIPFLVAYFSNIFQRNVKIRYKNFWSQDWSKVDYLYAFLSPEPMKRVTDQYLSLSKKPIFFINSFPLHIPHQKEVIAGEQILYIYYS